MATIGVDYKDKDETIDDQPMRLQIWVRRCREKVALAVQVSA